MGEEGFEPPKAAPTDLQSAPFDRSGTPPRKRADGRIRTADRLITNQLLWPTELHRHAPTKKCSPFPQKGLQKYKHINYKQSFYQKKILFEIIYRAVFLCASLVVAEALL